MKNKRKTKKKKRRKKGQGTSTENVRMGSNLRLLPRLGREQSAPGAKGPAVRVWMRRAKIAVLADLGLARRVNITMFAGEV